MDQSQRHPPAWILRFFRWVCEPQFLEDIEGDLLERFQQQAQTLGLQKANWLFAREVLLLLRPGIIRGIHREQINPFFLRMKTLQWFQLLALNGLVVGCIFLPFLPGPYDKFSQGLSSMAQVTGYVGLLLVPIGVLWLIGEFKRRAEPDLTVSDWGSGYYFALTATGVCVLLCLFFVLCLLVSMGPSAGIGALAVTGLLVYKLIPQIKRLKHVTGKTTFNPIPLYLVSIPIMAFAARAFFIGPASDYSRNYAIKQGSSLITAIEDYYRHQNRYPESINDLGDGIKPSIMGISGFEYERNGEGYNLYFVQWQHIGATREVVMYNKNDAHSVKGHFASYSAKQPHWRYYWLD